ASASRLSRSLCSCSATQMRFWFVLLDGCHGLCNRKLSPGMILALALVLLRSQNSEITPTFQAGFLRQNTQLGDEPPHCRIGPRTRRCVIAPNLLALLPRRY